MKREKRIIAATAFLLVILIVIINNRINRPLAYDPKSTEITRFRLHGRNSLLMKLKMRTGNFRLRKARISGWFTIPNCTKSGLKIKLRDISGSPHSKTALSGSYAM